MGCDIHMYVEYISPQVLEKDPKTSWRDFGGRINPGRDYELFAQLAGVRGTPAKGEPVAAGRGLPEGLAYAARDDSRMRVVPDDQEAGEGEVCMARALEWNKYGSKFIPLGDKPLYWIEHPDWHSPSWCTAAELQTAMRRSSRRWGGPGVEYYALLGACKALERQGQKVRIVMWFDN